MKDARYILSVLIMAGMLTACEKDSEKESIETDPIVFKKEGELSISKPSGEVYRELDIEIADNDFERQTGLMYRESMADNQAMLFIFPNAAPRAFYMKNTIIPLDIIYFGSDSTAVSFQENAKPMDVTPLPSGEPAQFVLEVNAGLVEEWGIEIGDRIDFEVTGD